MIEEVGSKTLRSLMNDFENCDFMKHKLNGHRCVIEVRCQQLLNKKHLLNDVSEMVISKLKEFIYTDDVDDLEEMTIHHELLVLFKLSEELNLVRLGSLIQKLLDEKVDVSNVFNIVVESKKIGITKGMDQCFRLIFSHPDKFVKKIKEHPEIAVDCFGVFYLFLQI